MKKYFEKELEKLSEESSKISEEIQLKVINPFCDKYNVKFYYDVFLFWFKTSDGIDLGTFSDKKIKKLYGKKFVKDFKEVYTILGMFRNFNCIENWKSYE